MLKITTSTLARRFEWPPPHDGEGGRQKGLRQAPQHLDLWVPKSQDKEDPIDPLHIGQEPHGGCEGS